MAYRKTDHYDPALTDELKVNFDAILKGVWPSGKKLLKATNFAKYYNQSMEEW